MSLDDDWFFPYNLVELMAVPLSEIDDQVRIVRRPIQVGDPDLCIGITPADWAPRQRSREIGHRPTHEPTLNDYQIVIQGIVHDFTEERGLKRHSRFARAIRSLLYRDQSLQVALRSEVVTDDFGVEERVQDVDIRSQEFFNNEVSDFVFLSTLTVVFTTEISST